MVHDMCPFCGCKVRIAKHTWKYCHDRYYIVHDVIVKKETGIDCILAYSILFIDRNELIDRWEGGF